MDQLLKLCCALFVALSLDFLGKFVSSNEIVLVQLHRLAQRVDSFDGVAATTLEQADQVMNVAVCRREIVGAVKSLGGCVVVSLSQRQYAPVGPTRRFTGGELREFRETRVGLYIVSDLQRREADVECSNQFVVFGGRFRWKVAGRAARACQR